MCTWSSGSLSACSRASLLSARIAAKFLWSRERKCGSSFSVAPLVLYAETPVSTASMSEHTSNSSTRLRAARGWATRFARCVRLARGFG